MLRRIDRYEEQGLGLPYPVVLINAAEELLNEQGERIGVRVPDLEGLATAVAVGRCLCPLALSGKEVRFIRRVLGYTQKELAEKMEISSDETISRWESGGPGAGYTEKLLRTITLIKLADATLGGSVHRKEIVDMHIVKRDGRELPEIVAERVHTEGEAQEVWDIPMLIAA